MTLQQLKYVLAVASKGSINEAAKSLFISQPSLSNAIKELEQELNELKNVKRPAVIKALKEARALGDLSENADYDAARNEQAQVEGRILELEKIMENAHIIKKGSNRF